MGQCLDSFNFQVGRNLFALAGMPSEISIVQLIRLLKGPESLNWSLVS